MCVCARKRGRRAPVRLARPPPAPLAPLLALQAPTQNEPIDFPFFFSRSARSPSPPYFQFFFVGGGGGGSGPRARGASSLLAQKLWTGACASLGPASGRPKPRCCAIAAAACLSGGDGAQLDDDNDAWSLFHSFNTFAQRSARFPRPLLEHLRKKV